MIRLFHSGFLFLLSLLTFAQSATYKIEFISNWSSATHPTDYPAGAAHWSPLVGASHKNGALVFQDGATATNGIEQVAETGGTSTITQEINALIDANLADQRIVGSGLSNGPGTITIDNITISAEFPYVSLITMIAPSPDWVAMIGNQKLTDDSGNWQTSISVDVYASDAGTDGGLTYTSSNNDITPHEPIKTLEGVAPFSNAIIGTFVFTLQEVLSINEEALRETISVYPNPVSDVIRIKNSSDLNLEKAEIYAASGKKIHETNTLRNGNTISVKGLSNGVYFLRLYTTQGSLNKKLIIQD